VRSAGGTKSQELAGKKGSLSNQKGGNSVSGSARRHEGGGHVQRLARGSGSESRAESSRFAHTDGVRGGQTPGRKTARFRGTTRPAPPKQTKEQAKRQVERNSETASKPSTGECQPQNADGAVLPPKSKDQGHPRGVVTLGGRPGRSRGKSSPRNLQVKRMRAQRGGQGPQ